MRWQIFTKFSVNSIELEALAVLNFCDQLRQQLWGLLTIDVILCMVLELRRLMEQQKTLVSFVS